MNMFKMSKIVNGDPRCIVVLNRAWYYRAKDGWGWEGGYPMSCFPA